MSARSLFFAVALGVAACGSGTKSAPSTTRAADPTLYDRLGRLDVIEAIVKDLVQVQLATDGRIFARYFQSADSARLEQVLAEQICELSGGPCKYTGRSMKEVHGGMGVDEAAWTAFVEDLQKSLAKFDIGDGEQRELIDALGKLHDDIVEKN